MTHPALAKRQKIIKAIQSASREPFQIALVDALENAPTPDAWHGFAERSPDKWSNAIKSLGELSGYTTRSETNAADVLSELAHLVEVLDNRSGTTRAQDAPQASVPTVLDGEVVEAPVEPNVAPSGSSAVLDASTPRSPVDMADVWP